MAGQEPNHPPTGNPPFLPTRPFVFLFLNFVLLALISLTHPRPSVTSAGSMNKQYLWFCVSPRVEGLEGTDSSPSQHSFGHSQLHSKRTGSAPSLMPPVSTQHGPQ